MQIGDGNTEMTWMLGNAKFSETSENIWSVSGYGVTAEIQVI